MLGDYYDDIPNIHAFSSCLNNNYKSNSYYNIDIPNANANGRQTNYENNNINYKRRIMPTIKIKYHDNEMPKIEFVNGSKSDWIDLRAVKEYNLKQGEFALIDLGVSVKLPEGYEAHIAPRSSTFKNYGIIQTNSVGVIDESYCGEDDVWKLPVYATRDVHIGKFDRICQFRILDKMKNIQIKEVDHLDSESRGGFGSSGVK